MAPRKNCLTCGSRQWRKNAVGLVTCSEGHVLQDYINESEEADGVGTHALRKRTFKSRRKKKEKPQGPGYHGDRARYHYYQCLQLLFRKQIAALTVLWNLPPEFETICRDLWVLHLNLIPNPPPAEPFYYTREQAGYQCEPGVVEKGESSRSETDTNTGFPGSTALVPERDPSTSEDEMLAPEITVLSEENSEVCSSDNGSPGDEARLRDNTLRNPFVSRADRPENTIALLVLACWIIRLPVIYMDFINAIELQSLPYLDYVRAFPSSLTRHLTKHAVQALSPHYAPQILSLHRLVSRLASRIYESFDVVIPEFNTAPVLWRVVQECFCGTPMLYILTKRLGNQLSLRLSLQGSPSARKETDGHKHDNVPPEVSLVATVIVVLKLVYGLDGKHRLPKRSDEAACAFPAVREFLAAIKEADQPQSRVNSHRFGSRVSLSVGDLDDTALDEYLDLCQKVLVDPKKDHGHTETEHRVLDRYFPLASERGHLIQDNGPGMRGREFPSTRQNDGDMAVLEPGAMYTIYNAQDVLGDLSDDLKLVVERAARWAGIESDLVCEVVERHERRLVRWWNGRRQERTEGDCQEGD